MPIHDQVAVTGVSEACKYNDHSDCRAPRCGCTCHIPPPSQEEIIGKLEAAAGKGPEKACPKCGVKRPQSETFCRIDGERLSSLLCGVCGSGMEVEDGFCWNCSSPKGKVAVSGDSIVSSKPTVLSIPELAGEVDYGRQILRGLQAEIAEGKVDNENEPQVVVEKPAGSQGSFTIVDKPNPNKVRSPANPGPGAPSPSRTPAIPGHRPIRLPVKPT